MSIDPARRAAFLEEMGLGPQWTRRDLPRPAEVPGAAAAVSEEAVVAAMPQQEEAAVIVDDFIDAFDAAPPAQPVLALAEDAGRAEEDAAIARMSWEELEQAIASCTRCGLCKGRTRAVPGVGDRKARWMFIGEGPGREEDQRGEPFVGRAGQLLDNMLAAMKLARGQNAYIANIVKCRPTDAAGKDRRPTAEEAAACLPYLLRQIALAQPDLVVALGKTSAVTLLGMDPETPVASLRGRVHTYAARPMVVTYHPAYLLRAPEDKRKAWADLCLALSEYAKLGAPG